MSLCASSIDCGYQANMEALVSKATKNVKEKNRGEDVYTSE